MLSLMSPQEIREQMKGHFKTPNDELHAAVRDDPERLQLLLQDENTKSLLNRENYAWGTPLHVAVWCGDLAAVVHLLQAGADPLIEWDDKPAIRLAATTGNESILRALWNARDPRTRAVDPDARANEYGLCLVAACEYGQAFAVAWMLGTWDGWTADVKRKALAAAVSQWQAGAVNVLFQNVDYDKTYVYQMLERACDLKPMPDRRAKPEYEQEDQDNQRMLVRTLIRTGLDPNSRSHFPDKPLLHRAASDIALGGALIGLLACRADPNMVDGTGQTLMHKLASPLPVKDAGSRTTAYSDHILLPLGYGASVSIRDENGESPLHLAALFLPCHFARLWLGFRQDSQYDLLMQINNHWETLLHYAAASANPKFLRYILELHAEVPTCSEDLPFTNDERIKGKIQLWGGLDVNAVSTNGWTPFLCALTRTARAPQERRVAFFQTTVTTNEKSGEDALQAAELLMSAGADTNVVSAEGWTSLHSLAGHEYQDDITADAAVALAEELIAKGADVNARASAFFQGWEENYKNVPWQWHLPWGFRGPKLMAQYPGAARAGITPLHWAAEHGCVSVARVLLAHGADPLAEDERGSTPETIARYTMRPGRSKQLIDEMVELLRAALTNP